MKTERKTCFIVGAGSFSGMSIRPEAEDLVIAADGGYKYLIELGIEPDVLLGDFDSLEIVPEHRHLIRHSPIKDDTDMALAVAYAKAEGYRRFFLYGGLGGRLDHTIANLQLMTGMSQDGLEVYLIGEGIIATTISGQMKPECTMNMLMEMTDETTNSIVDLIRDEKVANSFENAEVDLEQSAYVREEICFASSAQGMISVFCMGEPARGVWEKGLKYTLSDVVLPGNTTLGVSNEFLGYESSISVESGTLLVMWDEKNGLPVKRRTR